MDSMACSGFPLPSENREFPLSEQGISSSEQGIFGRGFEVAFLHGSAAHRRASPPGLDVVPHTLARSSDGMVRHVPIM
jgi:hypothetical protein